MWWPLTGVVLPDGAPAPGEHWRPHIVSERFTFRAVPGDISLFNRLACRPDSEGGAPYDVTALSVRAWAEARDRYIITRVGGSFGEGYGPKVVGRVGDASVRTVEDLRDTSTMIAVPGLRTTACMVMRLMLGPGHVALENLIEAHFAQIPSLVASGEVDAGLLIHEAQRTFAEAGLVELADLGAWWMGEHAQPLPLGVNAVRRDLDERFGPGSLEEVASLLKRSLDFALAHRDQSIDATMPYAHANAAIAGLPLPSRKTVEQYVDLYVTKLTLDMGESGRIAIDTLLNAGADADLCPRVPCVDIL
jgi:1,4-dihydroxy-6-naphthoate synthase